MEDYMGGRAFLKISSVVALKITSSIISRILGHTKKGPKTTCIVHIRYTFLN